MTKDQESLEQLLEAIEDLPRLPLKEWCAKHPEFDQLTCRPHPLEGPFSLSEENYLPERLKLELQLRMAKCLMRCTMNSSFTTSHHS